MSKRVCYYVKIWRTAYFEEDAKLKDIIKCIKENENSVDDIFQEELGFATDEIQYETESYIEPKDNEGNATIEVYDGEKMIWDNTKNKKKKK